VIHDFGDSLRASHAASDWAGWEPLYRKAFPSMVAMVDHRENGEHQLAGIDRSITLANSKQLLIDEKVRAKDYGDILLEVWSNKERKTPGWVTKALRADYIAYLIAPAGMCHLLPVIQLQNAWAKHGQFWTDRFGVKQAQNRSWVTESVPVPLEFLYPAIGACLRVQFEPWDPFASRAA
jgi:hypothetical protein